MKENLVVRNLDIQDHVLTVSVKAWKIAGFDFFPSINEKEKEQIIKTINKFDPFFGNKVKDHQILVYFPKLDGLDALTIKWWQRVLRTNDLPLSVQFTDIYNISFYFNLLNADPGWYLFTNKALPGSTEKSWSQQRQLLKEGYTVPNVNELVTFFTVAHLGGIVLEDKEIFARTVDSYYGVPLRVGQVINNRVNVVCESSAQTAEDFVGIYAYKKII